VTQASSLAPLQATTEQLAIGSQPMQVVPESKLPAEQVQSQAVAPVSLQLPLPHGFGVQSSWSRQLPSGNTSKPTAHFAQRESSPSEQTTSTQSVIGSHAVQVDWSCQVPARQSQM